MAFLDHIRRLQSFRAEEFVPWYADGEHLGYVHRALLPDMLRRGLMHYQHDRLTLAGQTSEARTEAVYAYLRSAENLPPLALRQEELDVAARFGDAPKLRIQRGAHELLGTRTWGVHLNGYTYFRGQLHLWAARRSRTKPTYPGKLDDMVAGGIACGLDPWQTLLKEAQEEAGLPHSLVAEALPAGLVAYRHQKGQLLEWNMPFVYDLEVPLGFVPTPVDQEVEAFSLLDIDEVINIIRTTTDYKDNCNLVIMDFLIRHGYLDASDPEFVEVILGLRYGLAQ